MEKGISMKVQCDIPFIDESFFYRELKNKCEYESHIDFIGDSEEISELRNLIQNLNKNVIKREKENSQIEILNIFNKNSQNNKKTITLKGKVLVNNSNSSKNSTKSNSSVESC